MPSINLAMGTWDYLDTGGEGPVLLFLHGLLMTPSVWGDVVADLRRDFRCVVPQLPYGGHRRPMTGALTPQAVVDAIAEFIQRLGLTDVTLIENDSGRAQTLAAERAELVIRLVLTSCEAFDNYPPGLPGKLLQLAAQVPGGLWLMAQPLRWRALRNSPIAFGSMSVRGVPQTLSDEWLEPFFNRRAIRADLLRYLKGARRTELEAAAEGLERFDKPALVAWGARDAMMPIAHGRRLAALLPQGRFVEIPDSSTLVMIDNPEALITELRRFLTERISHAA